MRNENAEMRNKKSTRVVIAVIAVLAAGVAVLAVLQGRGLAEKEQLRDDAAFVIIAGDRQYRVTMEEFLSLEQREVQANYKKSGRGPQARVYTGVPFVEILRMKGIDCAGMKSAVFTASDMYSSAVAMEEALDEEKCWIIVDEGDEGPFRMILPRAQFSQHWCKLLVEITLK